MSSAGWDSYYNSHIGAFNSIETLARERECAAMHDLPTLQAVILDLDGTLVDSAEDIRAAVNSLFAEVGLRPIAAAEIRAMIGDGVPKLIERALMAADAKPMDILDLVPPACRAKNPAPKGAASSTTSKQEPYP
jgi:hypothetical protein